MPALLATILGTSLAACAFALGDGWPWHLGPIVGWAGTLLAVVGAVRQYRNARPFELTFAKADWQSHDAGLALVVTASRHRKREPMVATYQREKHGWSACGCDRRIAPDGTVTLVTSMRFAGKLVIK